MKKIKTLSEQVQNLITQHKIPVEKEENTEHIDFNRSVERMLKDAFPMNDDKSSNTLKFDLSSKF